MSVPFMPKVARKAIEILTEPEYSQADYRLVSQALYKRIPDQHPILIDEHLQFAMDLIESAQRFARQVKAGELLQADALERLGKSFDAFEHESITRALAFALQA
jgi:hypothetical protein